MLTYNPPDRISAKQCMAHPYFQPPGRQLPTVQVSASPDEEDQSEDDEEGEDDEDGEGEDDDAEAEEDEDSMDYSPAPALMGRHRSMQRSPESPTSHLSSLPSPARSQSLMASPI